MTCCINLLEIHGIWKKEELRKKQSKSIYTELVEIALGEHGA